MKEEIKTSCTDTLLTSDPCAKEVNDLCEYDQIWKSEISLCIIAHPARGVSFGLYGVDC